MDFQETKIEAKKIVDELRSLAQTSRREALHDSHGPFQRDLDKILEMLDTQTFVVGVVGVIKAGKSTFLNALLHRNLLTSFIIPETAAITSISYSDKDQMRVRYWTKAEWGLIEQQAENESNGPRSQSRMARFVEKTRADLGSRFQDFVTDAGRSDSGIPLSEIGKYTSANYKNGLASLVREVEIGTGLEFCRDNIVIVDTPGLNDPIRLRENITIQQFLPRCDLVVLLLPAMQVFTDYDKRFLETQFRKGNIHKLFVVVNKIDGLNSPEEVDIVVRFVRQQIEETLEEAIDYSNSPDRHRNGVEIFPLSAYQSFLNRTEQHDKAKWTDEQSGVPAFEDCLRKFLFEGERAREMQTLVNDRLDRLIRSQMAQIEARLANIDTPIDELKATIEQAERAAESILTGLDRVSRENERSIRHFKVRYEDRIERLAVTIPTLSKNIEKKALEKLERFLERGVLNVVTEVEKWSKVEFEPFLESTVRDEIDIAVEQAVQDIEGYMKETLEEFESNYTVEVPSITLELPRTVTDEDYGRLIARALGVLVFGLTFREAVIAFVSRLSLYLAGILTGPIGWIIIGLSALWAGIRGGETFVRTAQADLRQGLHDRLPQVLDEVVEIIRSSFASEKPKLLEEMKKAADAPTDILRNELQQAENNLRELLAEKEAKTLDIEKECKELQDEKAVLEGLRGLTTALSQRGGHVTSSLV